MIKPNTPWLKTNILYNYSLFRATQAGKKYDKYKAHDLKRNQCSHFSEIVRTKGNMLCLDKCNVLAVINVG